MLCALGLLFLAADAAAQDRLAAGRIKIASGAAFIVRANSTIAAQPGQDVYEADTLKTGNDGRLGLTLKDDTRLSLGPNSEIRLDRFTFAPAEGRFAFALKVVKGVAAYVSGRIAKIAPDAVRLETPSAIVGVRGTMLVLRAQQIARYATPCADPGQVVGGPHNGLRRARRACEGAARGAGPPQATEPGCGAEPHGIDREMMRTTTGVVLVVLSAGLTAACAKPRIRSAAEPPDADLIMLLPEPGRTMVGGATVSNGGTSVVLEDAREFTLAGKDGGPARVRVMRQSEVTRRFGDVLATLPPEPEHFVLYFRFESDELTAESRAMVPDVLRALKGRPAPEISVVGHTDTTGTPTSNFDLGLKRGTMVRGLLAEAGLDPASVEVTSHGEGELLVKTPDETYEPRNRRVEITIR